jgi:hypothetical protein
MAQEMRESPILKSMTNDEELKVTLFIWNWCLYLDFTFIEETMNKVCFLS